MKTLTYAAAIALAVGFAPLAVSAQEATTESEAMNQANQYGTYDADQNAMLTEEEYGTIGKDFAQYDEDQSGYIDENEFMAWGENTWGENYDAEQTAGLFEDWDDNGDQQLTEDEWGDEEEFAEWDENQTGALEEDEGWF